jgi:hypothetical protein
VSIPGTSRLRELLRRLPHEDHGNAVIEFIGMAVLLLIPLVYLMLTFFTIQGAAFAAEGAAREAGRILSTGGESRTAELAAGLAFEDFDLGLDSPPALDVECEANPCSTPGARVHVTVSTRVTLPLINTGLAHTVGAVVPIEGRAVVVVDRFRVQE